MSRFVYDDPLAAMWMARHFGVTFDNGGTVALDCPGDIDLARHLGSERFVIHSDSLHLLTPRIGDIVLNCDDDPARVVRIGKPEYGHYEAPLRHAIEFVASGAATIIQRDGKPFHWPEQEAETQPRKEAP